jgi:hypothetical protein
MLGGAQTIGHPHAGIHNLLLLAQSVVRAVS